MTISEWISVIALIISAGGFSLQARGWLISGPRLSLSLMADAKTFPDDGQGHRLALIVINRGDTPTTLTHMISFSYTSWWRKFKRRSESSGVVNAPNIPYALPINGQWMGQMLYDKHTIPSREAGTLYVGVYASHRDKPYLIHVPIPRKRDLPTKQLPSTT